MGQPPPVRLDHITVAAADLHDGVAWATERLKGIVPPPGGAHPLMGTHNHLLRLESPVAGDPVKDGLFLEIIAPDPAVPDPPRCPRWFALDDPAFLADLRRGGPRLVTWVARTRDIDRTARLSPVPLGITDLVQRGALEWLITVPPDGSLTADGVVPALIQWDGDRPHPATAMADFGVRLESLTLHHRDPGLIARTLARLDVEEARPGGPVRVDPTPAAPRLVARLRLPSGEVVEIA